MSFIKTALIRSAFAIILCIMLVPVDPTFALGTTPLAVSPTLTRCPSGMTQLTDAVVGNALYFSADDGTGCSLWKSDGTYTETKKLKGFPNTRGPISLLNVNGTLFFMTYDGFRQELWKSDGTASGTVLIKTISSTSGISSGAPLLTNAHGVVIFNVNVGTNGNPSVKIWRSDGTESGTYQISDARIVGNPGTLMNGSVYFIGYTPAQGEELWKSDGTAEGTSTVRDINSGSAGSYINYNMLGSTTGSSELQVINNTLYFTATNGVNGQEIWKSDGTTEGTTMIADLNHCAPFVMGNLGTSVLFTNGCSSQSLWKTDGTVEGTTNISSIHVPFPQKAVTLDDFMYFSARDSVSGYELWRTDGTTTGTSLVKDIYPGTNNFSNTSGLLVFDNELYFSADDNTNGKQLWKSDGTAFGTTRITSIAPGTGADNPTPNRVFNNVFTFTTNSGNSGWEQNWKLWTLGDKIPTPTDLTATSPTNLPKLSWTSSYPASSYDIYRNGSKIASTTTKTYTDYTAPTGNVQYYVIAIDNAIDSEPSNTITVLVEKPAPIISATTPTKTPVLSWTTPYAPDAYDIYRNGIKIRTTTAQTYTDATAPEGSVSYYVVANYNNTYFEPSNTITLFVDKTPPIITGVTWTDNPLMQTQETNLQIAAQDALTNVSAVWYVIDGGSPQAMTRNTQSGLWEATFGSNLAVNTYAIAIYAEDTLTNRSASTSDILAVYNASNGYVTGHEWIIPSEADTLPIPQDTAINNPTKLVLGLTNIKSATSTTPSSGSFDVKYVVKQNKDEFTLSSTAITWLVIPDNEHASILGYADLTTYVNGVQTITQNVPVRIDVTLGANGSPDRVVLKIFDPGANPNIATPTYAVDAFAMPNKSNTFIRQ